MVLAARGVEPFRLLLACPLMNKTILLAFALMLVIEGLLPFAAPKTWRETFRRVTELADGQIRFIGLTSIVIGVALLMLFK